MMRPHATSKPRPSEFLGVDCLHTAQKMRAVLEVLAPQVHDGDHETTAEILHTGTQDSIAVELVRLLIYLETNNMVHRFKEITGCKINLSHPANMLGFLRRLGFLTKANIAWLGNSANPTNQVFLERLLDHSIVDEASFDVLDWLVPRHFDISHPVQIPSYYWIDTSRHYQYAEEQIEASTTRSSRTMLQASSLAGNTHAVGLLLDLDADPFEDGVYRDYSPLECAASLIHHDRATIIADSLLSAPTKCSPEHRKNALEGAFQLAIERANTKLILRLLSERKRLGYGTISSQHLKIAAERADCDTIRLLIDQAPHSISLPRDILFSAISENNPRHELDLLLDKLNYLLDLGANPAVSRCRRGCGRGFILDYVIGFSVRFEDQQIGEDFALSLADIMRKHGCPPERPKPSVGEEYEPSALQAAIYLGYPLLVEYLLDWGMNIDHYQDDADSKASACEECNLHTEDWFEYLEGRSPLLTALEHQETEIAKMLLRWNTNLKLRGGEQKLAMKSGDDTELVTMLLQAGTADIDGWEDFLEQAILWRNPRSTRILLSMDKDVHANIDTVTLLLAALITRDYDEAYRLVGVCHYHSRALFEAVILSHRSRDYLKIVERLLEIRLPTPNDGFEIRAVASAAIHQDMYLMAILMECFGQGPWVARFPRVREGHDEYLSRWVPEGDQPGSPMHILNYGAKLDKYHENATIIETLLEFGIPANGMYLDISDDLTAEIWKQLIAAGADPNHKGPLLHAVKSNMLEYVEVLCEAKVLLNTMHSVRTGGRSRTAIQIAVESGSPKMLQMLLHHGADVEYPAGYYGGATCLQLAAGAGNIGLVRLLLDKGAKVNAKRSLFHGRTAIETAAENGRLDVLKLLLLQDEHLFQTTAGRYQFIRAAKLAEMNGRGSIVKMLKHHINWDSDDQRLFNEIRDFNHLIIHLDEMTQKLLDSDKRDPDFGIDVHATSRKAGFENVYDIVGIEQWIGGLAEDVHDWTGTDDSSGRSNSERRDDLTPNSVSATSQHRAEIRAKTMPVGWPNSQAEFEWDVHQNGELTSACEDFHGPFDDPSDLNGDGTSKEPMGQCHAWTMNLESRAADHAWAHQATCHADEEPVLLESQDNGIEIGIHQVQYTQAMQVRMWEGLAHRPVAQNVSQKPGILQGEVVLDEKLEVNDSDGDAVESNGVEDVGEADQLYAQCFNWGFWDDESFALHSGDLSYW